MVFPILKPVPSAMASSVVQVVRVGEKKIKWIVVMGLKFPGLS